MRSFRVVWFSLSTLSLTAVTLWACSADNGPASTGEPTVGDSGSRSDTGSSTPPSTPPGTPPDVPPGDAGTDCSKPAQLFPPKGDGGMFCPFSAAPGGKDIYCTDTQTCCETPSGSSPSTCVPGKTTTCPVSGSTAWECLDDVNCQGGKVCCAYGTDGGPVSVGTDTCGPYLSHFGGTRCETSCAAGELSVCEAQSECKTGTCTAVKPKANDVGVCH
jgi:hypothetical protein